MAISLHPVFPLPVKLGLPAFQMLFFFFNDTATTEIYTLSLHDALPIYPPLGLPQPARALDRGGAPHREHEDRKSTRLNSSHLVISYAVFCLKKKTRRAPPPTSRASSGRPSAPRGRGRRCPCPADRPDRCGSGSRPAPPSAWRRRQDTGCRTGRASGTPDASPSGSASTSGSGLLPTGCATSTPRSPV